jgi:phosphoglucomutase
VAKLAGQDFSRPPETHTSSAAAAKLYTIISPRDGYLARLAELVRFDVIARSGLRLVYDALHGCGAGYLDRALSDHGIDPQTIRANRDVLFDGTGPDVCEENLAPLRKAVRASHAHLGTATDGDADRFGILDGEGAWISPNHLLALLYDYLLETRNWKLGVGRSVATSHLLDAVARLRGLPVYQTPVGFKYLAELIEEDKIALGGEESAGLSIRGHVPEKDGILACLLVAEMTAARGKPLRTQLRELFGRVGAEFWPLRTNLHLSEDVQQRTENQLQRDYREFLGRSVARLDRTDGLKLEFADGSWVLLRLSGTEPLLRVYTEASSPEASLQLAEQTRAWIFQSLS